MIDRDLMRQADMPSGWDDEPNLARASELSAGLAEDWFLGSPDKPLTFEEVVAFLNKTQEEEDGNR